MYTTREEREKKGEDNKWDGEKIYQVPGRSIYTYIILIPGILVYS